MSPGPLRMWFTIFSVAAFCAADEQCAGKKPMKVAVLGASGGTGSEITRRLLDNGHEVIAIARNPHRVKKRVGSQPANRIGSLKIVELDVMDVEVGVLAETIEGCDMVMVSLGSDSNTYKGAVTTGTTKILDAMVKAKVPRVAVCTAMGSGDSVQRLPKEMHYMLDVLTELVEADSITLKGRPGITAIAVRPTWLVNGPDKGKWKVASTKRALTVAQVEKAVPRASVAAFFMSLLHPGPHDGKGVEIIGT